VEFAELPLAELAEVQRKKRFLFSSYDKLSKKIFFSLRESSHRIQKVSAEKRLLANSAFLGYSFN
jgi:hypothetical protein